MRLNDQCSICGGRLVAQNNKTAACFDCGYLTTYRLYDDYSLDSHWGETKTKKKGHEVYLNGEYAYFEESV